MSLRRLSLALPPPGPLTLRFYASQSTPVTIGIRREDPGRIWERRVPLTIDAVAELVSRDNVRVLVQDCDRRVFPLEEYIRVRIMYVLFAHTLSLTTSTSRRRVRRGTRRLSLLT